MLSGTPSAAGTATFTVNVTDTAGATLTQPYTLTVNPALSIAPAALAGGHRGDGDQPDHHRVGRHKPYTTFSVSGFSAGRHGTDARNLATIRGGNGGALRHADGGGDGELHGQRHRYGRRNPDPALHPDRQYGAKIAPAALPEATAGTATSQTITVSGGSTPYTSLSIPVSRRGTGLTAANLTTDAAAGTVMLDGTRIMYRFSDYGDQDYFHIGPSNVDYQTHMIFGGLGIKFNGLLGQ